MCDLRVGREGASQGAPRIGCPDGRSAVLCRGPASSARCREEPEMEVDPPAPQNPPAMPRAWFPVGHSYWGSHHRPAAVPAPYLVQCSGGSEVQAGCWGQFLAQCFWVTWLDLGARWPQGHRDNRGCITWVESGSRSGSRVRDGGRPAGSSARVMALPKSRVRQRQAPSRTPKDGSSPYLGQLQVGEHPHTVVGAVRGAAGIVGRAQLSILDAGGGYTVDGVRDPEAAKEYLPLHPKKQASGSGSAPGASSGAPGCSHLQVVVTARRRRSR